MQLLTEAFHAMGAVLLQIAVALLFEELTFGGLVRLILAPRPESETNQEPQAKGEKQCSH
jgi:hypothetical protein